MIRVVRTPRNAHERISQVERQMRGPGIVKVGLPANSGAYPDGTPVVLVGITQEFGSPARGVPARSYLRSTIAENRAEYMRLIKALGKKVLLGKMTGEQALQMLGLKVQTDVRQKITDIKDPALTSREGNPLVDTGLLRSSVVYVVEE